MGTCMAPSYVNMDNAKTDHLVEYINGIFAVWPYGEENLQVLLIEINLFRATIKFTAKWSRESVTFLDTKVIHDGNGLVTNL